MEAAAEKEGEDDEEDEKRRLPDRTPPEVAELSLLSSSPLLARAVDEPAREAPASSDPLGEKGPRRDLSPASRSARELVVGEMYRSEDVESSRPRAVSRVSSVGGRGRGGASVEVACTSRYSARGDDDSWRAVRARNASSPTIPETCASGERVEEAASTAEGGRPVADTGLGSPRTEPVPAPPVLAERRCWWLALRRANRSMRASCWPLVGPSGVLSAEPPTRALGALALGGLLGGRRDGGGVAAPPVACS